MERKSKSFVYNDTIRKNVRELSYPAESQLCNVGKHKVVVTRSERLDYYGNPVYTATVLDREGGTLGSYRSNGSAALVVQGALKRSGVNVRYRKPKNIKSTKIDF